VAQIKEKADAIVLKKEKGGVDAKKLIQKINQLQKKLAFIQSRKEIDFLVELKQKLDALLASWDRLPLSYVERELARFEGGYLASVEEGLNKIRAMDLSSSIAVEGIPSEIKRRFVGKNGDFLIYVFPKKSVWSDAALTRFTEELLLVDPQATGTPFLVQEVTRLMEKGYLRSGWLALVVVTLLLLIDFRRIVPTLLALVPLLMGVVWMVGLMGLLEIDFNPANLIAVPLILGIAIDNGVHLVHRFYEKKAHRLDHIMQSTIKAVYLNSITTIACFGALILASHRGISSLGLVLVLGVLTCLITAITFLPALLSLLRNRKQ
jgi:predicted RND superfamily exporter protein